MEIQTNLMEIKPPSAKSLLIGGVIVVVTLFIAIIVLSTHKVVSSHNNTNQQNYSSSNNLGNTANQNSQQSKSYKPTNYIPRPEAAIRSRQPPKILHSNSNTDDVSHHYNHRHVSISLFWITHSTRCIIQKRTNTVHTNGSVCSITFQTKYEPMPC